MTSVETLYSLAVTKVAVENTLLAKVIHIVREDRVIVRTHFFHFGIF
jgi:hypothetical protein